MLQLLRSDFPAQPLPTAISDLIERAEDAIEAYSEELGEQLSPRFEMADYREVASALITIQNDQLTQGPNCIEWGAGFAVVAAIANQLGFKASGVENDPILLAAARQFHAGEGLDTNLIEADYREPIHARADLIYAYPWPKEVKAVKEHVAATAMPGTHLLLFRSFGEMELWHLAE